MNGHENLVPISQRSTDEVREMGKKGGKKSGESRRAKRDLKECLNILLESKVLNADGKKVTVAEELAAVAINKAISGDSKWWELVRDTAGQKPGQKVDLGEDTRELISSASQMSMADKIALIKAAAKDLPND